MKGLKRGDVYTSELLEEFTKTKMEKTVFNMC